MATPLEQYSRVEIVGHASGGACHCFEDDAKMEERAPERIYLSRHRPRSDRRRVLESDAPLTERRIDGNEAKFMDALITMRQIHGAHLIRSRQETMGKLELGQSQSGIRVACFQRRTIMIKQRKWPKTLQSYRRMRTHHLRNRRQSVDAEKGAHRDNNEEHTHPGCHGNSSS